MEGERGDVNDGVVVWLDGLFELGGGEVRGGGGGESDNDGIVVLFEWFDGNGEEFGSVER